MTVRVRRWDGSGVVFCLRYIGGLFVPLVLIILTKDRCFFDKPSVYKGARMGG